MPVVLKRQLSVSGSLRRALLLLFFLYLFLAGVHMMGGAFKVFKGEMFDFLAGATANPFVGLFAGILTTAVLQSSSTTTAIVVVLVGSGGLPIGNAIPIIMGANIGTSVTNLIVSLGCAARRTEFRRAFAAAVVHDIFNLIAVLVLFPLERATHFLEKGATFLAARLAHGSGFTVGTEVITRAVSPPADLVRHLAQNVFDLPRWGVAVASLAVGLAVILVALFFFVKLMRSAVGGPMERVLDRVFFGNPMLAMGFGLIITAIVQSSSVTTSIVVPLAGAALLNLEQIFPFVLGANVGTTVTALLASFALENKEAALTVALTHVLFNISGIVLVYPWRRVRAIPIRLARMLAAAVSRKRWLAVLYVALVFFVIPLTMILLWRLLSGP